MTHGSPDRARSRFAARIASFLVCAVCVQCGKSPTGPSSNPSPNPGPTVPGPSPIPTVPTPGPEVAVAVGDIAICSPTSGAQEATAKLLDTIGGRIFTLGDNAYPNGSVSDFRDCFEKSWGRHRGRIFPTSGNHEYQTPGAAPYYQYFGDAAGPSGLGYYSFDLGAWHVVSLNSNADAGVGVGPGSAQVSWLQADLAQNKARCTVAYWHHPLFSSGQNGDNPVMQPIFSVLYDNNADLVLTGHDHLYERFGPQRSDGAPDAARGLREFVVGTGGVPLYRFVTTKANSEVRIGDTTGVLKLTLLADSYQWEFVTPGGIRDNGTALCH